ncbi:MAG: PAS domain S-box protein, partial [Chloroherpetonaceae bacterium]|nr:PAS domain S-box protein [Chloroherpetonaceae bacterium]
MLSELRSLIPDENLCAKVLALLEAELEKREAQHKELEETLQHTIETLHGEVREKLRLQEEFRRNTEQKFHIAAELAGEYIYEATVDDGKIRALYVSPEFAHLTGYGIDEINAGNGWLDFIYPDDLPTVRSAVANILSGKPAKTEYRVRCKDGRTLWIRDFSQPFLDEQGRYVKSIGVSRNITAEKEAELALRREQQLLDALFNTVPLGICLSDEEGTFLRINRELSNILGYEAADLLGKHFSFVLAEEYRELAKEAHQTFMAGDSLITSGEWPIQRKDGERRWVQVVTRKFQREDGRWFRVTAIRDITREREQEKERAHLLELLARTEALAHIGSYEVSLKPYCFTKWS